MPKIQVPKRIRTEDFDPDYQALVDRIGGCVNDFADEVYKVLNGGIDFGNLSQQIINLDLTTDGSGGLINPPPIKFNIPGYRLKGMQVISATNLVNSNIYVTSQPFISWTINGNIITILNVTGLPINSSFRLTVILIGG